MSIYLKLLNKAERGIAFNIDLNKKNLKIGKKLYVKEGELLVDDELINQNDLESVLGEAITHENSWEVLKKLFKKYKYSAPGQEYKNKSFFKALPSEELTDGDLAFNESRHYSQALLEGFVLLASLSSLLKWNSDGWFWQDCEDENFIVLKKWIV